MASPPLPLLLLLLFLTSVAGDGTINGDCSANTSLTGFEAELSMLQHQLRGIVRVVDGCAFSVRRLDLLPGSSDARWWLANGTDFAGLSAGRPAAELPLDRLLRNETLTLRLLPGVSWDQFSVLAAWDPATASDFGHVVLSPSSSAAAAAAPTMFDNCVQITPKYRVRWTLNSSSNSISIGLEAAMDSEYYMAFGWADPEATSSAMIHGDVVVAGFTEDGAPFADDYYITQYSECSDQDGTVAGVCPDSVYPGAANATDPVNNSRLVYGQHRDGVLFVRYDRPLVSPDHEYDVAVSETEEMVVMWAIGKMRPPDPLWSFYLPQNHGGPRQETFGFIRLNVSELANECLGPLDADDKEDQEQITADGNTPLVVTSALALNYPNPPNPSKVIYINKKEAPVLKVERGVPVKFSIQAGRDVALYITSDPIGGNAKSRNSTEIVYAGGAEANGVSDSPTELVWLPRRNTPDEVYYQNLYEPKMGYKVRVVDGGLSDMYNNSVALDDQQVTLFWTLTGDSISIAARGEKKSGYLAVALGTGMLRSYAYVGWVDRAGAGHVSTYWIDGKDAAGVHRTSENLTYAKCKSEKGIITLEFTRLLKPACRGRVECKNIVDPTAALKVIWAMGARWSDDELSEKNMHSSMSSRPTRVLLMRGAAEAEQDLHPVLAVHGFMMFVAWGVLLPGGILAARYLKNLKSDGWYRIHIYFQYSGIVIMLLGVLFAAAEVHGFSFVSTHVKFGMATLVLGCAQPVNAYFRPKKPAAPGEAPSAKRVLWEYLHVSVGRASICIGVAALFTGMMHLGGEYGYENVEGLSWALIMWVILAGLVALYLEYMEVKRRRSDAGRSMAQWVMGNAEEEEDDAAELLHGNGDHRPELRSTYGMEVQLEPINR